MRRGRVAGYRRARAQGRAAPGPCRSPRTPRERRRASGALPRYRTGSANASVSTSAEKRLAGEQCGCRCGGSVCDAPRGYTRARRRVAWSAWPPHYWPASEQRGHASARTVHGPPPLRAQLGPGARAALVSPRCRASGYDVRACTPSAFLWIWPPFMISARRSRCCSTAMSRNGSPSTTSRSASLPGWIVPSRCPR